MDSQKIKAHSADEIDQQDEKKPPSTEATGKFSTAFQSGIRNATGRQSRPVGSSGTNVSPSGRFQINTPVPGGGSKNKPVDRNVGKDSAPNFPLFSEDSLVSAESGGTKGSVPATASFSAESVQPSRIVRSTGPLQILRRGNRLDAGIRLGKDYRLQKHLGNGQCGETWLAKEAESNNLVVLKPIPQSIQDDEAAVSAVLNSFRRVSALQFPGICPIYRLAQDEILGYFMVSAFADALPLNEYYERYCQSFSDFPISVAASILRQAASALDFAHAKKTTHRMLKPQNILIGKHCGVVVSDFEITEVIREALSRKSAQSDSVSAAHWQAPEVWTDRRYSPYSDQFSLGALACQLITGEQPFYGEDEEELKASILFDEPLIDESLPESIRLTLQKSLAKKPEDRFPSCTAFMAELMKSPEFESDPSTLNTELWSFKDLETTLDPQDAPQQVDLTFPYVDKPRGEAVFPIHVPFFFFGIAAAVLLAVFLGIFFVFGTSNSANSAPQQTIGLSKESVPQNSTESKTTSDLKQSDSGSQSGIGTSVWSRHVEPIPQAEFAQFVRSAANGDSTAQRRLGEVYFYGKGVKPDYYKAVEYFQLASELGDAAAMYHLGRCCELGLGGVTRDTAKAIEIYKKAAQKDSVPAAAALKRLDVKKL